MGGYGSGRWGWHRKKTQVEECLKLTIYFLKPYLRAGNGGTVRWSRGDEERASIGYEVSACKQPKSVQLNYTINARKGCPEELSCSVNLTTTPLPWGGFRYWFVCPLKGCSQRVGCLYLPPGGKYSLEEGNEGTAHLIADAGHGDLLRMGSRHAVQRGRPLRSPSGGPAHRFRG